MSDNIYLSPQIIDDEIKQAVMRVLDSGAFILKNKSKEFETGFTQYIGARHGALVSSATSALHLGLKALGISDGEVIVPSHTAFPTIEAVIHAGARPVFVDIDSETFTMDPKLVEQHITPRTKAIIPVHLYGHAADVDPIAELAESRGIHLIEDAAQAHGAEYKGKRVGARGAFSIFSFYPSKNLSVCGDGGILLTNNDDVAGYVRMMRDHGRVDKYSHDRVGFNMRFNEIQAAVGVIHLKRLDRYNDRRRAIAATYRSQLADVVTVPAEQEWSKHVYHMFVIRTQQRDQLAAFLKERGIHTGIHYPLACHQQPAMRDLPKGPLPETENAVKEILSLPISPHLRDDEVQRVCEAVRSFFSNAQ